MTAVRGTATSETSAVPPRAREGRHLAAVMFVDMVGYSARMQDNEARAIEAVRWLWQQVRPILSAQGGREVDLAGDGMLMEFPGALSAVRCALQIHGMLRDENARRAEADRIRIRAGVHLGDIEHRDGRIYGDGINIAARIIGLSPPGAVAMTAHVHDQLVNVLEMPVQSLGLRALKNIKKPLQIWCVCGPECSPAELQAAQHDGAAVRQRWRFGDAELDERRRELRLDGQLVQLRGKPLEVLIHLLRHAGEAVSQDQLAQACWPGRILSDSVLNRTVSRLREALGDRDQTIIKTLHGYGYQFVSAVSTGDAIEAEAAVTLQHRPHNLPAPVTTLIGREQALRLTQALLRRPEVRLLTLSGPGGIGKTRLSLQLATELLADFEHGVFLVDLAPITDPALFFPAIAKVLEVRETAGRPLADSLKDSLRSKQVLLLLDNFEQVLAAAPLVAELLAACPRLKVLATSREALRLRGEHEFEVPSLKVPDIRQGLGLEALADCSAIALFAQRAQMVKPDFSVTAANAADVAEICSRLDGLPLAIELAAARSKLFTPALMREQLSRCFELLKEGARDLPDRHQALWTTIDWSYQLLEANEQALFRRLAVFVGGFTLEAAKEVCAGEPVMADDVLHLLARLVAKSLLLYEDQGQAGRYRMLETIRHYGRSRLQDGSPTDLGQLTEIRARHLAYFVRLAQATNAHLWFFLPDSQMAAWKSRMETELDNVRSALTWSAECPASSEAGMRLASMLYWFWMERGYIRESQALLEKLLRRDVPTSAGNRAQALLAAGNLAVEQGGYGYAREALMESLELFRAIPDHSWTAFALSSLGSLAVTEGNGAEAAQWVKEGLALARKVNDSWLIGYLTHFSGRAAYFQQDYLSASAAFEESIAVCRNMGGNKTGQGYGTYMIARIARVQGDLVKCRELHLQALRLFHDSENLQGAAYALTGLGGVAALQIQARLAVTLLSTVAGWRSAMHIHLEPDVSAEHAQDLASARALLDDGAYATAWAEGQAMTLEQAVARALKVDL